MLWAPGPPIPSYLMIRSGRSTASFQEREAVVRIIRRAFENKGCGTGHPAAGMANPRPSAAPVEWIIANSPGHR